MVAATEQLSASVSEISANVEQVVEATRNAAAIAETAAGTNGELETSSHAISNVTDLFDDVAEQTNCWP